MAEITLGSFLAEGGKTSLMDRGMTEVLYKTMNNVVGVGVTRRKKLFCQPQRQFQTQKLKAEGLGQKEGLPCKA